MKLVGKIFAAVYRTASALLVAAAAAVLVLLFLGIRPYAVITGSMEPAIPQGSICFVNSRAAFSNISEGDVIVFRRGELVVTHRAVRVDEAGVTTKGDANNAEDTGGKVTEENYVGKVVFWLPLIGKVVLYARTVRGRIVVIGAFVLFLAAGPLYDRIAEGREEENPEEDKTDG